MPGYREYLTMFNILSAVLIRIMMAIFGNQEKMFPIDNGEDCYGERFKVENLVPYGRGIKVYDNGNCSLFSTRHVLTNFDIDLMKHNKNLFVYGDCEETEVCAVISTRNGRSRLFVQSSENPDQEDIKRFIFAGSPMNYTGSFKLKTYSKLQNYSYCRCMYVNSDKNVNIVMKKRKNVEFLMFKKIKSNVTMLRPVASGGTLADHSLLGPQN